MGGREGSDGRKGPRVTTRSGIVFFWFVLFCFFIFIFWFCFFFVVDFFFFILVFFLLYLRFRGQYMGYREVRDGRKGP